MRKRKRKKGKNEEERCKEAQFNLGIMYRKGHGVGQSDATSAKWYHKAADEEYAMAQHNLGRCTPMDRACL